METIEDIVAVKHQFREVTKTIPREEVDVAENATTTPTCDKSSQVGDRMLDLLNRVHDFLGKLCRDGRCDDHCSECIDASDLADNVWDLIQSCKEPSQVGNAAKMYEALKTISKCDISKYEDCYTLYRVCEAALSAPPRNCDRFSNNEQAWDAYCEYMSDSNVMFLDYEDWLFAEAKGDDDAR